jgi:hypothetical protein
MSGSADLFMGLIQPGANYMINTRKTSQSDAGFDVKHLDTPEFSSPSVKAQAA